ncbi:hypothetical protein SDJN02_25262, partial [Cucurbita argyrosperma subsp. argyrosperma]
MDYESTTMDDDEPLLGKIKAKTQKRSSSSFERDVRKLFAATNRARQSPTSLMKIKFLLAQFL